MRCASHSFTLQLHINLGLNKLKETQAGVEDMQKGLAQKERRLRYKNTVFSRVHLLFFFFRRGMCFIRSRWSFLADVCGFTGWAANAIYPVF